jgi:hypothetical protein
MAPERRNQVVLALAVALLGVVSYRTLRAPSGDGAPASNGTAAGQTTANRDSPVAAQAPAVHLPALQAERPKPGNAGRNLFRFKPKAQPQVTAPKAPPPMQVATGPPPPPPTPPIPLKFIGFVDPGGQRPKIAVLSDTSGHVFQGTQGETIEGRYRILHIGVESVEIAYLDGSGRRTIRLTGS